ncbi:MAG: hypothetical protein ACLPVY_16855 [Acidimicrobiia bacterium]
MSIDKSEEAQHANTMATMIAGGVDDRPIVLDELVEAAPANVTRFAVDSGLSVLDLLAGNMSGIDPLAGGRHCSVVVGWRSSRHPRRQAPET